MQETLDLLSYRRNRLADHGFNTIHDAANELSAPLENSRSKPLDEANSLIKAALHRTIDISTDIWCYSAWH